jgi:hypothetical protein
MAARQDYPPSFKQGFARCAAERAYPDLWRGLVGAWAPMLGVTGNRLPDWSGYRRNGSVVNGVWAAGPAGVGVYCTGGNYCSTAPASLNVAAGDFTVAILFRPRTWPGAYTALVDKGHSDAREFALFATTGGDLNYYSIGGIYGDCSIATSMTAGGLWMLTVTRRGTAVSFYVNGRITGQLSSSGVAATGDAMDLGYNSSGGGVHGDADYYCNYLWNRAISTAEALQLYADPYALFVPRRHAYGSASRRPCAAYRRVLASSYGESR